MKRLFFLLIIFFLSTVTYSQVAKQFLEGIESKPPFKGIKDTIELKNTIIEEATKKRGLLNFWEYFDEKSLDGYEIEDSIYTSARGIPSYLWGKALAVLGIDNMATISDLYQKVRGYKPDPLRLKYIELGFNKGREKSQATH
jgi:hypothetical protein